MNGKKFFHISDLHFFKSDHLKGRKDGIHHFEIKMRILDTISLFLVEQKIDAFLISGDLELDDCDILIPYLKDWNERDIRVFIVFGEHDSRELREQLLKKTNALDKTFVMNDTEVIDDSALAFYVYGMSCESKQEGFIHTFLDLQRADNQKPGVFLTHPNRLPHLKMKELACSYYATGHIHAHHFERIDKDIFLGRPGQLYSLWDGDGKAWPTGGIIGEFTDDGLRLSWYEFPIEQTIRIYIDPYRLKNGQSHLVIENCSEKRSMELLKRIDGEWIDQGYRGVFQYDLDKGQADVQSEIKQILEVFAGEIIVTPSDPMAMKKKYGSSRAVFHVNTLLSNEAYFEEYLDRIVKATPNTQ